MMMNGLLLDDNLSNITSASNEDASISSGNRNKGTGTNLYPQQPPNKPLPSKRKRNLPGNPDPESEVVALSPQTLMATNRFLCEICNKGFKRDQNLQLHRRGHNLPWKLKQRENKDQVKKKVYVCPETTCVHHDPSRALGDLTGIKKHFFRKHGEKKWKCEKCAKRYAVQTDWKAHFKICGTREYRCDCGTIFSRRDSFITHRAFCDALAEENAMANTTQTNSIFSSNSQFPPYPFPLKTELQEQLPGNSNFSIPPWLSTQTGPNANHTDKFFPQNLNAHMSATSLLQKAAQIGVTFSNPQQTHGGQTFTASTGLFFSTGLANANAMSPGSGNLFTHPHQELSAPFLGKTNAGSGDFEMVGSLPSFEEAFGGILNQKMGSGDFERPMFSKTGLHKGQGQDLTRDFLGLRAMTQGGFANISGLDHQINSPSSYDQHSQNQTPWQV